MPWWYYLIAIPLILVTGYAIGFLLGKWAGRRAALQRREYEKQWSQLKREQRETRDKLAELVGPHFAEFAIPKSRLEETANDWVRRTERELYKRHSRYWGE